MIQELGDAIITFYRHLIEGFAEIWTDLMTDPYYATPRVFIFSVLGLLICTGIFLMAVEFYTKRRN